MRIVVDPRVFEKIEGGIERPRPPAMGGVVDRIDHGARSVGGAEPALGGARGAIPELDIGALLFADLADQLTFEIGPDRSRKTQAFVVAEDGRLESVPGQHEPRGRCV